MSCSSRSSTTWRWRSRRPPTDWKPGACDLIPGQTAQACIAVERDDPNPHARFSALGPQMEKVGDGGKGIS